MSGDGYIEVRRWNPSDNPALSVPVYMAEEGEVIRVPHDAERSGDWVLVPGQSFDSKIKRVWVRSPKGAAKIDPNEYKFKVDSERGTRQATVFSVWGKSYLDCKDPQGKSDKALAESPCVAWPNETATFKVLDSMFAEVNNARGDDPTVPRRRWQLFYQVEYSYKPDGHPQKTGVGWISAQDLRLVTSEEQAESPHLPGPVPYVGKAPVTGVEPCAPDSLEVKEQRSIESVNDRVRNPTLADVIDDIAPHMGECALNANREFPDIQDGKAAFDQTMVPFWKGKKVSAELTGLDGKPIDKKTLFEIDALARTIYGEMATTCLGRGEGYLMAVARVAVNRADYVDDGGKRWRLFVESKSDRDKGTVASVVGARAKFSVWNKYHMNEVGELGPNSRLLQVLCPASSTRHKAYMKRPGTAEEVKKWRKSLEIAAQAILDPKKFKERTKAVTQYFYTSGMGSRDKFKRVKPKVEGKVLDRGRCIELWVGPDP